MTGKLKLIQGGAQGDHPELETLAHRLATTAHDLAQRLLAAQSRPTADDMIDAMVSAATRAHQQLGTLLAPYPQAQVQERSDRRVLAQVQEALSDLAIDLELYLSE